MLRSAILIHFIRMHSITQAFLFALLPLSVSLHFPRSRFIYET